MARRKHREGAGPAQGAGRPGAVQHRLRQRRLLDLLRAGRRGRCSALGVTPLVFLLTGLLFCTTAWSYAEATAMVPEAGGSSSFARRAFNEFVSFGAGWALHARLHRHDRHLGVLRAQLPGRVLAGAQDVPVQRHRRHRHDRRPRHHQRDRHQGGGAAQHHAGAARPRAPRCCSWCIGVVLLLEPAAAHRPGPSGRRRRPGTQLIYGISIGTVAYTGIETVSNMAEEAANPDRDVPRAINFVLVAVLVVYLGISMIALSAMPVESNVLPFDADDGQDGARAGRRQERRPAQRAASSSRERTPPGNDGARRRRHPRSRRATSTSLRRAEIRSRPGDGRSSQRDGTAGDTKLLRHAARQRLPRGSGRRHRHASARRLAWLEGDPDAVGRHPGGHDPRDRDQRRHHRRLAARLLAGPAPAGPADPRPRAPAAHDAVRRDHRLRRGRLPAPHAAGRHDRPCWPTCTPSAR